MIMGCGIDNVDILGTVNPLTNATRSSFDMPGFLNYK